MATLPQTRKEAQRLGAAHYFTGKPCKHGHIALRKAKGSCVECLKIEWANGCDSRAEYFRAYNRSEAGQEAKQRYYEANKRHVIAKARSTPNALKNAYRKKWKDEHPVQVLADNKVRRRKHRSATPPWITRQQKTEMRSIYQIAITMSQTTGERYVVDHIWPLRSDFVCGLHVPWNLRVITQADNLLKSNNLPSDEDALAFHKG